MSKNLKKLYVEKIRPELMKEFSYENVMQVPKLVKVCINRGVGKATENGKLVDSYADELAALSGQKPLINKSKKSIANFKLRENLPIGCSVTLRGKRMYEFLNKLLNIVLPKIRDFRGVKPNSFDGRGNYTLGIKEQIIFPEINYEKVTLLGGMDITIVTTAKNNKEAFALLEKLGMPFRK